MKLLLSIERRLVAAALLGEDVQKHGAVFRLEELEGLNEKGKIVAVDGAEVLQAELLKQDGGPEHAFGGFFGAAHDSDGGFAAEVFYKARCRLVEVPIVLVGDDAVEVAGDGADVAVDGPLIVIEDNDEPLGLLGDVVERFKGDAVGECGIAGNGDNVFLAAGQIAGNGHAERCREGGASVSRAVAIVLALSAQHEAVEAAGLADGFKAVKPAGENFVHVGLVADIEEQLVFRRIKNSVQGEGELDYAQVGAEVAAGL